MKITVSIAENVNGQEQVCQMSELVAKLADTESELEAGNAEVNELQTNINHMLEATEAKACEFGQLKKEFEESKQHLEKLQEGSIENAERLCAKEKDVKSPQQQMVWGSEEKVADKVLEVANLQSKVAGK